MSELVKITDDELQALQSIHTRLKQLVQQLGELHYEQRTLSNQLGAVNSELDQLDNTRATMVQQMEATYGQGVVDLNNGTFIKSE